MKTKIALIVAFFCLTLTYAQVGINNTSPNALLDIKSSNQASPSSTDGILIPRVDEFPGVNPGSAQDGMMIFVTGNGSESKGLYYWDNLATNWNAVGGTNSTGLERLDEGNGLGWRLIGGDTSNYGNIGLHAVDFSRQLISGDYGATGKSSFASGQRNTASGQFSTTMGIDNIASEIASVAIGQSNLANSPWSVALGRSNETDAFDAIAIGWGVISRSRSSISIGMNNLGLQTSPVTSPYNLLPNDPIFEIGNGTSDTNRSNAMTVLKNGNTTINGSITGIIESPNNASLRPSWTAYDGSYGTPGYYKDNNRTFLRGLLRKTGSYVAGEVIFTLPEGYRPSSRKLCAGGQQGKNVRIDILSNGNVQYMGGSNGSNFVSLEDISFDLH